MKEKISITPELLASLLAHKKRTKVGVVKLLHYKIIHPKGLTQAKVTSWLSGKVKTANKDHIDYVLDRWSSYPTIEAEIIDITDDILKEILLYKNHTGMGAGEFLAALSNVPIGLKAETINNWLRGIKTAREDHLRFVLIEWKKLAEKGVDRIKLTPEIMQKIYNYKKEKLLPKTIFIDADNIPSGLRSSIVSSWLSGHTKTAKRAHVFYVLDRCEKMRAAKKL